LLLSAVFCPDAQEHIHDDNLIAVDTWMPKIKKTPLKLRWEKLCSVFARFRSTQRFLTAVYMDLKSYGLRCHMITSKE
jgi:hypothetical protein